MLPDGTGFVTLRLLSGLDGASPAALLQLPDGRLYGTTQGGGANGHGTVFMMRPDGSNFEVLYAFGGQDGDAPSAPVVADPSGSLYGTTARGGPRGGGVVFKLVPPPAPSLVVGPADAWIGLKNSDDVGTSFDLRAEVFQDAVLVASGQLNCVSGGGSGFNNARLRTIALTPATVNPGTTLKIRLSVRISAPAVAIEAAPRGSGSMTPTPTLAWRRRSAAVHSTTSCWMDSSWGRQWATDRRRPRTCSSTVLGMGTRSRPSGHGAWSNSGSPWREKRRSPHDRSCPRESASGPVALRA